MHENFEISLAFLICDSAGYSINSKTNFKKYPVILCMKVGRKLNVLTFI